MPTWFVTGVAALSLVLALLAGYRVDWTRARAGKILAFVALFLLPVAAASLGFSRHMERAQTREFCVSCHVREQHDRSLPLDNRAYLPAWHFQNNLVPREKACYTCHTDYTLFGGVEAKIRGLRHLWIEYLGTIPPPEKIRTYEPYPNRECLHCHSQQRLLEEGPAP